jgi:hypothetical protein
VLETWMFPVAPLEVIPAEEPLTSVALALLVSVNVPAPVTLFVEQSRDPVTVSDLLEATGKSLFSVSDAPLLIVQSMFVFVSVPADWVNDFAEPVKLTGLLGFPPVAVNVPPV